MKAALTMLLWDVSVQWATVETAVVWCHRSLAMVMDIAMATVYIFCCMQNALTVWMEVPATLPQNSVTARPHLMDLIVISLPTIFQSHGCTSYWINLVFFHPSCGTGCENGALYNSDTEECDCTPGNSGPLCGEWWLVELQYEWSCI